MSNCAFERESAAVAMIKSYCSLSVLSSREPFSEMAATKAQKLSGLSVLRNSAAWNLKAIVTMIKT